MARQRNETADGAGDAQDVQIDEQAKADAQQSIAEQDQRAQDARQDAAADATYAGGVAGANVNFAVPADSGPAITTYEDALEAGYMGIAAGHANTAKMSVAAVTARDQKLGLPGTRGLKGGVVNGAGDEQAQKGEQQPAEQS